MDAILAKINKALAALNRKSRTNAASNTYSMLFNQLVVPIITSNACIWGHKEHKRILQSQYAALRFLLGVGKACPISALFGESGWISLLHSIKFAILIFRYRLYKMDGERIPSKVCTRSDQLRRKGKLNCRPTGLNYYLNPAGGLSLDEI